MNILNSIKGFFTTLFSKEEVEYIGVLPFMVKLTEERISKLKKGDYLLKYNTGYVPLYDPQKGCIDIQEIIDINKEKTTFELEDGDPNYRHFKIYTKTITSHIGKQELLSANWYVDTRQKNKE